MNLGIRAFTYDDLYDLRKLNELATEFDSFLDPDLFRRFDDYRTAKTTLSEPDESALLIAVSRELGKFLKQLFDTDDAQIKARAERDAEVARFKKEFVTKRVAKWSVGFSPPKFLRSIHTIPNYR